MKKQNAYLSLKCLLWIIAYTLLLHAKDYAQNNPPGVHAITGKIIDKTSGDPVVNATVTIKGSRVSAVTDETGSFSLQVKSGDILVASSVGFATQEATVGSG